MSTTPTPARFGADVPLSAQTRVVRLLTTRGLTLATAESLTGGGLGSSVTSVPGASAVYLGGVVSYATRVKEELLHVPSELVLRAGVVSAECARAMAEAVRELVGADLGLSTTGVAGPEQQEGKPAGLVFLGMADGAGSVAVELRLDGDRAEVRSATVEAALQALLTFCGGPRREVGQSR